MSLIAHASSASSSSSNLQLFQQDALWQMNMRSLEQMESGPYPVRDGEPYPVRDGEPYPVRDGEPYPVRDGERDCFYYIQTGLCRFGATCRFNHPPHRTLAIATARVKGEYPEQIGQRECQFYLKTGTCKFGMQCKFHHPRDKAGIAGRVALNVLGYPLRPNKTECAYYMISGKCKFGSTCKFNHPHPSNMMASFSGSALYPPNHSPATGELTYPGVAFFPSPRWQSPSSYAPLMMPQGVLSVPWNTYSGQVGPVSPSENLHQTAGNSQNDGMLRQGEGIDVGSQFYSNSLPFGHYVFQTDNVFPERLGQPECKFYMKTGNCKFGTLCKFHHPRERFIPVLGCILSPIGLPLRPGESLCVFYSRYGVCKFGPSCKFDHPMTVPPYNVAAASSSTDHFMASSPGTVGLSFSPDVLVEAGSTDNRCLSLSDARQKSSGDSITDRE